MGLFLEVQCDQLLASSENRRRAGAVEDNCSTWQHVRSRKTGVLKGFFEFLREHRPRLRTEDVAMLKRRKSLPKNEFSSGKTGAEHDRERGNGCWENKDFTVESWCRVNAIFR